MTDIDKGYVFKAQLQDFARPIWRRLLVPQTATFYDLHVTIQDAFGWNGQKRHEFRVIREQHRKPAVIISDPKWGDERYPVLPEKEVSLATYYDSITSLTYAYDFARDFRVRVMKERVVELDDGKYPCLISRKGTFRNANI